MADGFIPAIDLTLDRAQALLPLGLYAPLALVREFLPAMLARGDGAILSAQGASARQGLPHIAGGFALAAQAAGEWVPEMLTVDPHHLADLLWTMHQTRNRPEATYPEVH